MCNLTDELNSLKQKQNGHYQKLEVMWVKVLEEKNMILPVINQHSGQNYASFIKNRDAPQMIRESLAAINPNQINEYKRLVTDRIPDALSLKLHPIDENLKVRDSKWISYFKKS